MVFIKGVLFVDCLCLSTVCSLYSIMPRLSPFRARSLNWKGKRQFSSSNVSPTFFPYGKSDFESIIKSKKFFVDNSRYIREFEDIGVNIIFTRPPRWGKTLLQSMFQKYYDVNTSPKLFKELFGDLEIYKNITPGARSFHVLPIDMTIVVNDDLHIIKRSMCNNIIVELKSFVRRYKIDGADIYPDDANASMQSVIDALRFQCPDAKLYIMIDEYDRFANKLMVENLDMYQKMVVGTSGDPASSPIRSFLENIKVHHLISLIDVLYL